MMTVNRFKGGAALSATLKNRCLEASRAGDWQTSFQLAREYIRQFEDDPYGWIQLAGARYHLDRGHLGEAWKILTTAHLLFPQEPIISATMASLAAIDGDTLLAKQCLQKTLELQNQRTRSDASNASTSHSESSFSAGLHH